MKAKSTIEISRGELDARIEHARREATRWLVIAYNIAGKDEGLERFCDALGKANWFNRDAEVLEDILRKFWKIY